MRETFVGSSVDVIYNKIENKYGDDFEIVESKEILVDSKHCYEISIEISKDLFFENSFGKKALDRVREKPLSPHYIDLKNRFIKQGISADWIEDVFGMLQEEIGDEHLLEQYLLEEIESSLSLSPQIDFAPQIIMVAGTTGVGKTTTLAKLAARYGYTMPRAHSVALVNLDHYRVGATEQLKTYAEMMQIPFKNAYTDEEFVKVLEALKGIDVIFVDTAGASPFDIKKILQTTTFLAQEQSIGISVFLVVSATMKLCDIEEMYSHFSFLDPDGLIVTKLDETRHIGELLNFLIHCPTPIAYFTIGQEVPNDLEVASALYLIERFRKQLSNA